MTGTRTTEYILGTNPHKGFDGIVSASADTGTPPFGLPDFHRMTLHVSDTRVYNPCGLAELFGKAGDHVVFFCDNGFFDEQTDNRVYEALLSKKGRVAIIGPVYDEMKPWMDNHSDHIVTRAVRGRSEAVSFTHIDRTDPVIVAAAEYYTHLLYLRKRIVDLSAAKFEQEQGRPPNENELRKIRDALHNREIGPRGYTLAKKGEAEAESPNRLTDELLTVLSVMAGLTRSRETVILTKDQDVLEQFYKLQFLLDTHYRGMLLADCFQGNPRGFISVPMPTNNRSLSEVFSVGDGIIVERSDQLLQEILPPKFTPSPYQCWLLGKKSNTLTQYCFTADTEMRQVLEVKGKTKGLNTEKLAGKNCHIWLAPLLIEKQYRGCAIASDRRYQVSTVEVPRLDVLQTLNCQERFKRLQLPQT